MTVFDFSNRGHERCRTMPGRRTALGIGSLLTVVTVLTLAAAAQSNAQEQVQSQRKPGFKWSQNLAIAAPEAGKQRAETALATDKNGRISLSYLDTDYKFL